MTIRRERRMSNTGPRTIDDVRPVLNNPSNEQRPSAGTKAAKFQTSNRRLEAMSSAIHHSSVEWSRPIGRIEPTNARTQSYSACNEIKEADWRQIANGKRGKILTDDRSINSNTSPIRRHFDCIVCRRIDRVAFDDGGNFPGRARGRLSE